MNICPKNQKDMLGAKSPKFEQGNVYQSEASFSSKHGKFV